MCVWSSFDSSSFDTVHKILFILQALFILQDSFDSSIIVLYVNQFLLQIWFYLILFEN